MSKHKTLAEKKRSKKRKDQSHTDAFSYVSRRSNTIKAKEVSEDALLVTEPKYIMQDLAKTLLLSVVFLLLLIGLYISAKSNNPLFPFLS